MALKNGAKKAKDLLALRSITCDLDCVLCSSRLAAQKHVDALLLTVHTVLSFSDVLTTKFGNDTRGGKNIENHITSCIRGCDSSKEGYIIIAKLCFLLSLQIFGKKEISESSGIKADPEKKF